MVLRGQKGLATFTPLSWPFFDMRKTRVTWRAREKDDDALWLIKQEQKTRRRASGLSALCFFELQERHSFFSLGHFLFVCSCFWNRKKLRLSELVVNKCLHFRNPCRRVVGFASLRNNFSNFRHGPIFILLFLWDFNGAAARIARNFWFWWDFGRLRETVFKSDENVCRTAWKGVYIGPKIENHGSKEARWVILEAFNSIVD